MNSKEIEYFISEFPDWYQEGDELVAGFEFKDFQGVTVLICDLLPVIEECNHHPTVTFGYNTVEIRTTSHDEGNKITEKDLKLAAKISRLVT
ncbi:hypothetical protein CL638_01900 [bacterium]|nr:hypothetical protein [bacterium]|tara:strand:- start:44 stop:319 length:276 start_codon:yes stop_codon:yes gene_type:complete